MGQGHFALWKTVPDGAREIPPGGVCPKCRSPKVHRSRPRGAFEQLLRSLGPWRPFACAACQWRGWAWPQVGEGPVLALPPAPEPARRRRTHHGQHKPSRSSRGPTRARHVRQLLLALVLAACAAGVFVYCQQAPALTDQN